VRAKHIASPLWRTCGVCIALWMSLIAAVAVAQTQPAAASTDLRGRPVEGVRVVGNSQVATPIILNVVRTREGDPYDPDTVVEDYQRIYALRRFSNVEAKIEPTETGVIVVFIVQEQRQIRSIAFLGNSKIETSKIMDVVDVREGEAIDRFRISLARREIERLYKEKNFPFAHVDVPPEPLATRGELIFNIVEGPNVKVRKTDFIGNNSFSRDRLKEEIRTRYWIWIFRPGTFDPETVEDDVAALRRFYEGKGFFDVRVGRKLIWSPDLSELEVNYVIEEGPRYVIEKVTFKGLSRVSEADLRARMRLLEGAYYDSGVIQRDTREIVRAYSPFGMIYQPQSSDPDYLRINTVPVFRGEPGKVELIYEISEGRPFRLGRILVTGNYKSQDKLVLREMRMQPGQTYDAGAVQDAQERIRGTPYFSNITMTPVGEEPDTRDLLVEVQEARTATFSLGAGVNSNGGIGGNITYEQRNFDLFNFPDTWQELFTDKAFTGAGQNFRASFEPGTRATNASLRFSEPYLFDQPYSFSGEVYLRDRIREHYDDRRLGGRVSFGKRFNYVYSGLISLRGESVRIHDIEDEELRAKEIIDAKGSSTLTSVGIQFRRDTTTRGLLPSKGTTTTVGYELFGALGGDYSFHKYSASWDGFYTLYEDLIERKTILELHADIGYIAAEAPFFERFYGGGIGSVRGFEFRGISPRSGREDDPVGGDFAATYTVQVSFPLAGESLRGVVFTDGGTVEETFRLDDFRSSIGFGFRLALEFFGQAPLALDFALPLAKNSEDDVQYISFSFGFVQ
jgi:outer membrane protein insertion porin family